MWVTCYSMIQREEFQHMKDNFKAVHFSIYPD